jgi:hypothetical protein
MNPTFTKSNFLHGNQLPLDLSYLWIKTYIGKEWTVHIQSGGGFLGILSVIKMLAEKNWRQRKNMENGPKTGPDLNI